MRKNLLLVSILVSFLLRTNAQDKIFGLEAGPNLSGALVKYPPYPYTDPTPLPGISLGAFVDFALHSKLYTFRPALYYSLERASSEVEGDKATVHVSFIKIPLNVIYHPPAPDSKWSFGAGLFVAYNLGGAYNWVDTRVNSLAFGNNQNGDFGRTYKRIDFGIDLLAFYKINEQWQVKGELDFGLLNEVHTTEEGTAAAIHTLNLGFTAVYTLGEKPGAKPAGRK